MKQFIYVMLTFLVVVLLYGLAVRWYFRGKSSVQNQTKKLAPMYDIVGEKSSKIFSKQELAAYDGNAQSPGLYLGIMGRVYDVSKGPQYYGPGGGYAFFSGKFM